ncbi:alpha/beta hydrolase fold protein [Tepidimonas alkaliphilus]|uniref:Alpha/beta hydrolase fold protein n=1 Tax=Tepidimonas alkaliphilus TaxID=2588942 RepID=A0A554WBP4_9BURK|nr:alpha/beta hydrolase fold protein [Tepidimonas alkaliphilus]
MPPVPAEEDWPAAPWLHWGGHGQTIAAALWGLRGRGAKTQPQRQRWTTPDGDFVDADLWVNAGAPEDPVVVLFHGLEGSSRSHYAQALVTVAQRRGWTVVVPHFRGCSGEPNRAPRAYHSGDHDEIDWMLRQVRRLWPHGRLRAVGVSLGGNALLRWLQEQGHRARAVIEAAAAISAPLDLQAAGAAIDRGFNRWLYARYFLRTMRAKAAAFAQRHPGWIDGRRAARAPTLRAFDDAFTAPLHGFAGVDDYWRRASSRAHLARIELPTLVLNARNDPLVPARSLPQPHEAGRWVRLWQPTRGGHVGFAQRRSRWDGRGDLTDLWTRVLDWLDAAAKVSELHSRGA